MATVGCEANTERDLNTVETNDTVPCNGSENGASQLHENPPAYVRAASGMSSKHPRERWNIIARALKSLKSKLGHISEATDLPHANDSDVDDAGGDGDDDNDGDGEASVSAESSIDGLTASDNVPHRKSAELMNNENDATANKDVSGGSRSEAVSVSQIGTPSTRKPRSRKTTNSDDESLTPLDRSGGIRTGGLPEPLKNSLVIMLSGIYGIMLVVMGLVLPLSEIFDNASHPYFFEVFYLYLYSVSMAFLVYVYTYLLRKERLFILNLPRTITKTLSRTLSRTSLRSRRSSSFSEKSGSGQGKPLVRYNSSTLSSASQRRKRKIAYNPGTSSHTGSFYLRVGVIVFGFGSLIHSGLTFGHYFEINHFANHCSDAIQAIKPFALLCFTFVQMYFIFMNSKMCVHKYKTFARFGLMHMCCTNICVWLRSIVVETLMVMKFNSRDTQTALVQMTEETIEPRGTTMRDVLPDFDATYKDEQTAFVPELSCNLDAMMGKVLESSSVYLYPCTIEFSLVCACVLYVMWSNVGEGMTSASRDSCSDLEGSNSDDDSDSDNAHHRMSVDCAASSKGLFLGILLFVVAVVCLVCFYVLTSTRSHVTAGTLIGHVCEEIILVVTFVATAVASFQMREMRFSIQQKVGIEEILTLISISGLGLYGVWSIVAAMFHLDTLHGRLTIITNLFMLVQAASQATFTLLALRASARNSDQLRTKPGRQCVTFLLICNFALWVINTFETQRLEHNQTQVNFYGTTAWSIFSHVSVPLGIYFRFHSTVNLSIVWKKAWKKKDTQHSSPMHARRVSSKSMI